MPSFIAVREPGASRAWSFEEADQWALRFGALGPPAYAVVAVAPLRAESGFVFGLLTRGDKAGALALLAASRAAFPDLCFGDMAPLAESA